MNQLKQLKKLMGETLNRSFYAEQMGHLAEDINSEFNLQRLSGFSRKISIPKQVAVDTMFNFFTKENMALISERSDTPPLWDLG